MSQENREVKTSVNVKQTSALKKGATAALILEETAIDSSLEELDRRNEENNKTDLLSKPTAVQSGNDADNLRSSLLSYFTSQYQQGDTTGDNWRELYEALKE